jgi:hypothetical protein
MRLFSACTPRLRDAIELIVQQCEDEKDTTDKRPDCNFEAIKELNLDVYIYRRVFERH